MESTSKDPFILRFQEIFRSLTPPNSPMDRDALEVSLGGIFEELNRSRSSQFEMGGLQCDASEFLDGCIDRLIESEDPVVSGATRECFGFSIRETTYQKIEGRGMEVSASHILLQLNVAPTLGQSLEHFSTPEELRCVVVDGNPQEDAYKYSRMENLPPFLFIQFKRFIFNPSPNPIQITLGDNQIIIKGRESTKDVRGIDFPDNLTFPSEAMQDGVPRKLKLVGYMTHNGTINGGHYITYLRKTPYEFIECNDSMVSLFKITNYMPKPLKVARKSMYVVLYELEGKPKNDEDTRLFTEWQRITGIDVVPTTPDGMRELIDQILGERDILIPALAALKDQAPQGSWAGDFADFVLESVKQVIENRLPQAMEELGRIAGEYQLEGRYLQWIEFLAGSEVEGLFRKTSRANNLATYKKLQEFWVDCTINVENYHNIVQPVFPNKAPSHNRNPDLYMECFSELWGRILRGECPSLLLNIQVCMKLSTLRMFHHWGFKFTFRGNAVVLEDDPNSKLHKDGDHNQARATRVLEALRIFGCTYMFNMFEKLLEENYEDSPAYGEYWVHQFERTGSEL